MPRLVDETIQCRSACVGLADAGQQALACLTTFYDIPQEHRGELLLSLRSRLEGVLDQWHAEFSSDLYESHLGYSKKGIRSTPELEDLLLDEIERSGICSGFRKKENAPTICLSHDIDYLEVTLQMAIKRFVASRKLTFRRKSYLSSIEKMLETEQEIIGRDNVTSVFLALGVRSGSAGSRLKQWLMDPSYSEEDSLFRELCGLLTLYRCEIGLHGSLFSLEGDSLGEERRRLMASTGAKVLAGRQHWLNLPNRDSFGKIYDAGIRIDSSLGWNGAVGFRGGFSRPFPIVLPERGSLFEIPLVLMDGPLFDDLNLSQDEVVEKSIAILEQVKLRRGCVSINWHDRAADADYNWFPAYLEIVRWAKENGFSFQTFSDAYAHYGDTVNV